MKLPSSTNHQAFRPQLSAARAPRSCSAAYPTLSPTLRQALLAPSSVSPPHPQLSRPHSSLHLGRTAYGHTEVEPAVGGTARRRRIRRGVEEWRSTNCDGRQKKNRSGNGAGIGIVDGMGVRMEGAGAFRTAFGGMDRGGRSLRWTWEGRLVVRLGRESIRRRAEVEVHLVRSRSSAEPGTKSHWDRVRRGTARGRSCAARNTLRTRRYTEGYKRAEESHVRCLAGRMVEAYAATEAGNRSQHAAELSVPEAQWTARHKAIHMKR